MPSGLVALLDDITGIAKLAAASLDDVTAAAGKAGSKAAGVVIDDAAVTPRYVVGLTPDRELPIIARIAWGSVKNKILYLLPLCLVLSAFAPWGLTPLLMLGGTYLCFEAVEKIFEALFHPHDETEDAIATMTSAELEQQKVSGAIRTDFILSGEIMAISLASVASQPIWEQAIILAIVAVAITAGVYGVVAIIVKMDDVGLHLAKKRSALVRAVGGGLVRTVPGVMRALSIVGTAAMLWVGGGILVHGLHDFGLHAAPDVIDHIALGAAATLPALHGIIAWLVNALGAAIVGSVVGGMVVAVVEAVKRARA